MKDYLQPAATFALALAIASLPLTIPIAAQAYSVVYLRDSTVSVRHLNSCTN